MIMNAKIIVLKNFDIEYVKNALSGYVGKVASYTEDDFTNVTKEDVFRFGGGTGRIVCNTLTRFVINVIVDAKRSGEKPIVYLDDFICKMDWSESVAERIEPLLDVTACIIFCAKYEDSVQRLASSGLPVEVYSKV